MTSGGSLAYNVAALKYNVERGIYMYYIDGSQFKEGSVSGTVVAVLDGVRLREKSISGNVLVVIDGDKIREKSISGNVLVVIDGDKIREKSISGTVIAKMYDIRKNFKNPMGGHSLVAFWVAYIR